MDYLGSFDKYELVEYLTEEEGFREEGGSEKADCVIVDNDFKVGRNCLTFMETIGGFFSTWSIRSAARRKISTTTFSLVQSVSKYDSFIYFYLLSEEDIAVTVTG